MTSHTLTTGQQKGADQFFDFLFNDDAETFVISGSAGCGKTFLMTYLCQTVMKNYEDACKMLAIRQKYHAVSFTATTNKAAEVLENSLNVPVQTIHSFLGLKVNENYSTGKTNLIKTASWGVRENIIIFIDECSMIDSQLYAVIRQSFNNCKIVFVGDHAQMAPIDEDLSPLYKDVDPGNFVVLTEPVRNAGQPALVDLCNQLRHTVEANEFHPIPSSPAVRYLNDDEMVQKLDEHFKDPDPSCRILCYTNERVQQFNEHIRENVRHQPTEYQVGEVLVVAQTLVSKKMTLNVERQVKIKHLGDVESDPRFEGDFPDGKGIQYRTAVIECLSGDHAQFTVKLPLRMDRVMIARKHFAKIKDWTNFFDLKNSYADLRDKAACTVYKAQGSTYDTVFVDIGNIGKSFSEKQVARMLFVAISRAKSQVYLYGSLPGRYAGARAA